MSEWISVEDRLPTIDDCNGDCHFAFLIVAVLDSHYPKSSYDLCTAPWQREFVTNATYDTEQKIWDVCGCQLNALIPIGESPLNGMCVTHWMRMPEPPGVET